jgi:uncharacterized protein YodC (DUF2158 family)
MYSKNRTYYCVYLFFETYMFRESADLWNNLNPLSNKVQALSNKIWFWQITKQLWQSFQSSLYMKGTWKCAWFQRTNKHSSSPLISTPFLAKINYSYKRDGLSWREGGGGHFSSILLSQCLWNLAKRSGCLRHRAINLFLKCYKCQWLNTEEYEKKILIEDVTVRLRPYIYSHS